MNKTLDVIPSNSVIIQGDYPIDSFTEKYFYASVKKKKS